MNNKDALPFFTAVIFFALAVLFVLKEIIFGFGPAGAAAAQTQFLNFFMEWMSNLGNAAVPAGLCALFIIVRRSRKTIALPVCVSLGVSFVLYEVLKVIFTPGRRDLFTLLAQTNNGFPAGHAMNNAALYSMLVFMAYQYLKRMPLKLAVSFLCALMVIGIGYSRVYLKIHTIWDIIGGWVIGFLTAAAVYFTWKKKSGINAKD